MKATAYIIAVSALLVSISCTPGNTFMRWTQSWGHQELAGRGNCLPIDAANLRVDRNIHLAHASIQDVVWRSNTELFAISNEGTFFTVNIARRIVSDVAYFDSGNWSILVPNIISAVVYDRGGSAFGAGSPLKFTSVDRNGNVNWQLDYSGKTLFSEPIAYNGDIFLPFHGQNNMSEIYIVSGYGDEKQTASLDLPSNGRLIPTPDGIVITSSAGNYILIPGEDDLYAVEPWNQYSGSVSWGTIIDESDRLIGFDQYANLLYILGIDSELPSSIPGLLSGALQDEMCVTVASDGDSIAVFMPEQALRLVDGNSELLWAMENVSGTIGQRYMYIDEDFENCVELSGGKIVVYNSGGDTEIQVGGNITTDLVFSNDFRRAAVGTAQGDLVTLSTY